MAIEIETRKTIENIEKPMFTPMDVRILQGLADGLTTREIAKEVFHLAYSTVKNLRAELIDKGRFLMQNSSSHDPEGILNLLIAGAVEAGKIQNNNGSNAREELTNHQAMIADMICEGKSSRSIASILEIGQGTVKNHKNMIFEKLDVHSVYQLAAKWTAIKLDKKCRRPQIRY